MTQKEHIAGLSADEPVWHLGHRFLLDSRLSTVMGRPTATCSRCGDRSDNDDGRLRHCFGHSLYIPPTGAGLMLDVEFTPKGRKTIKENVWLDIDALGALLDMARKMPRECRGHAFWHWKNPATEFPCESCPSPLGDKAKALAAARVSAIDVPVAPPKLPDTTAPEANR